MTEPTIRDFAALAELLERFQTIIREETEAAFELAEDVTEWDRGYLEGYLTAMRYAEFRVRRVAA